LLRCKRPNWPGSSVPVTENAIDAAFEAMSPQRLLPCSSLQARSISRAGGATDQVQTGDQHKGCQGDRLRGADEVIE